jgi:amino acid adenylation domain-containing protein
MKPAKEVFYENTVIDALNAHFQRLTEDERHKLFVQWNATQTAYPHDQCISQLFEMQVESTPDAVALVFEGQELTYRQLNERANQLAQHLRKQGVGPEGRVGLCVERSLGMVVGLLGILKAGGAYVPLDPAYPQERLAFMLGDARVQVLITQQRLLPILPLHEKVVCLDTDRRLIAQESTENRPVAATSESLLYIMYTSGSTGQPKGVMGTHCAAINRFHWMWTTYPFYAEEVCCQKTALSFVDSVWEIFGPLLKGIRTVIIPESVTKDPKSLLHTLAVHAVTRIVLVPSLLRALIETGEDLKDLLPNLKYCVSSGEALSFDLARRFLKNVPQCALLNLYGSSEVAADVTCYDTRQGCEAPSCIPIGRPIANTQIYLLDEQMQPVRIGEMGELYVGGDGLARGYFGRPELTTARFVPHPFSVEPEAKLYKTGDLARYLPDGNIEYLGRLDQQVKIRGVRIELGEIEVALREHPVVHDVVVVAHEVNPGDKRLVAYLVPSQSQGKSLTTPPVSALHEHLMKSLPASMVPSTFIWLDALPLTPNGKVDRRALPAPELTRRSLEEAFVAPTSMNQHLLRQIWEKLLNVRPIGVQV